MIKVGIVSENFNHDSKAIRVLLEKRYDKRQIKFLPIVKRLEGDGLMGAKLKRLLKEEAEKKKLDFLLFIKDLDGLPSETEKVEKIEKWFSNFKHYPTKNNLLFIPVYELESLILADFQTFAEKYKIKKQFKGNPLFKEEPKEYLKNLTARTSNPYHETQIVEIFQALIFENVHENHHGDYSFQAFIETLDKRLGYDQN